MTGIWLPGYTRLSGRRSGALPRVPDAPARCVLHTDEAGSNTRSLAQRHQFPPQLWVNPAAREKYQLISLDRTGYALLHPAGAPETNHMGRCIQVEIAGHARDTHEWPDEWLRWIALEVVRPIHEHAGVPLVAHRPVGLDSVEAYGRHAPTRMSRAAWRTFSGFCTHQNVPDNEHWDCGRLDLGRILTYAQEDDMTVKNVVGQDLAGRWWWFKSTTSTGVEIDQPTADFWYMVDKHMYTNSPELIERLKRANVLVALDGTVSRA